MMEARQGWPRIKRLSLAVTAAVALVAAFAGGRAGRLLWARRQAVLAARAIPADAPDSVKLAARGLRVGQELTAYVFASSRCGFCQDKGTKRAVASLRGALASTYGQTFKTIRVIGVALDNDVQDGMGYLSSVGLEAFDEVSVGGGWFNSNLVELTWRGGHSSAMVPQVLLFGRGVSAIAEPFLVRFSSDSLVSVLRGRDELLRFVNGPPKVPAVP